MLGENEFRLVQSPGLVLGLAAGDTFELRDDRSHRLLRRGGNICVQLYRNGTVDEWRPLTEEILGEVGARLDGASDEQLVFTVPAAGGFPRLEAALAQVVAAFPRCQWFYGNVYDERDGTTPLNWWLSRSESQT